jgi:hypothetical protein
MRNGVATVLLFLAGGVCVYLYRQNATLRSQQISSSGVTSFEIQERCARQAEHQFQALGYSSSSQEPLSSFESHYNPNLKVCFMRIRNFSTSSGSPSNTDIVFDAVEGTPYGSYNWINTKGKKYWEVAPWDCEATPPNMEKKTCHSSEEFNLLMKQYMER